jgi:hypothetical protein
MEAFPETEPTVERRTSNFELSTPAALGRWTLDVGRWTFMVAMRPGRCQITRRVSRLLAVVLLLVLSLAGWGQGTRPAYELKALWISKFAMNTEWLASAPGKGAPYRLLLIGRFEDQAGLRDMLQNHTFKEGTSKEGTFVVDTRKSYGSKKDLEGYHIVVVSKDIATQFIQSILLDLKDATVLTVGEEEGFTRKGGVVSMVIKGDDIFFEVNRESARNAKLKIDDEFLERIRSKLLTLK